jgi:hypothetical protein
VNIAKDGGKADPLYLASRCQYNYIDWNNLTEKDITSFNDKGYTFLHYVAEHGYWKRLPIKLRDSKYWKESKGGDTVYICAFRGKDTDWIDKKSLSTKDLLTKNNIGQSIATLAAEYKEFAEFPKEIITKEVLLTPLTAQRKWDKLIHFLAQTGQIPAVPHELLTEELLSTKGRGGNTVFHALAENNYTDDIKPELWTVKNLTLTSYDKTTPLHTIAQYRTHILPKDITLQELTLRTREGFTPIHAWARGHNWKEIPDKFLTQESLKLKDNYGTKLIYQITQRFKTDEAIAPTKINAVLNSKMKSILSKIDDKTLHSLAADENSSLVKHVKAEMGKRKLLKELSGTKQSLEL